MMDRVHACLDGDFPRHQLTPAELARLESLEAALAPAADALRAAPTPDLAAAVMRSLPAHPPRPAAAAPARRRWVGARLRDWLWTPRVITVRYRPALAAMGLGVAALAGVVAAPRLASPTPDAVVMASADGTTRLYVQFRLEAPNAENVELAGSFTGWRPDYRLTEVAPGVWSVLVPLQPGVHDYTFVVDGERWVADPYAPQVDDDFGGTNSRLFLPSPQGSA